MSCKSRIVKWQRTREVITKKKYNGESSPYGEWVDKHSKKDEGESKEFPEANPDVLVERDQPEENLTRKIILKHWREIKFSRKEREILVLLSEGLSQTAIAKRLKVTQARVGGAIARIQKKGSAWYGYKTSNGSIYSTEEESE